MNLPLKPITFLRLRKTRDTQNQGQTDRFRCLSKEMNCRSVSESWSLKQARRTHHLHYRRHAETGQMVSCVLAPTDGDGL
jgi:hypothetical protein